MLHKSFKPAKCKTALKLAASRIKLLKNKREAQIKQLKRELAQLLEAGQDQTARIRVEHVVREEKTMAAYDLIEIYCELIAARLPIIESQKSCPIDLKEAIASLIFASPRCADLPELMDVRKHLTAKYGKEFTSAAVELRPDCGVSRLLVEKLSAKAPDGPTKIKILSAIAEEHNIKWEPKSFEEKYNQPPVDLLNGPSTFEQASNIHVKPQNVQEPMNGGDKIPMNFEFPSRNQDSNWNSLGRNSTPSTHSEKFPSADLGSNGNMPSGTSHPDLRPSGMEFENPDQHGSGFSSGRQSWPMEFKDATSAAQAAAEAAERASMAARAAAELSSEGRISRQHSGESWNSSSFPSGDQRRQGYAGSNLKNEYVAKVPVNSSHAANYGMPDDQIDSEEQDDLSGLTARFYNLKNSNKPSNPASSKLTSASVDDSSTVNNPQKIDTYSHNSSSESGRRQLSGEESVTRESGESELDLTGRVEDGMKDDKVDLFGEPTIRKQHSSSSSHYHSGTISDDHMLPNFDHHKLWEESENPFAVGGKIGRSTEETGSYENVTAVFDDSDSEEGDININDVEEHTIHQSSSYFSSEGRLSSSLPFTDNAFSPRRNIDESRQKFSSESPFASEKSSTLFLEGSTNHEVASHSDGVLPVTFDDSDGPSSDGEKELPKSGIVGSEGIGVFPHKETVNPGNPLPMQHDHPHVMGSSLAERENVGSIRKTWLQSSSHDLDDVEVPQRNQEKKANDETRRKLSYGNLDMSQFSSNRLKSQSDSSDISHDFQVSGSSSMMDNIQRNELLDTVEDDYSVQDSGLESGRELNFGMLSGGLRNKGYRHPPYHRKPSNSSALTEAKVENFSKRIDESSSSKLDDYSVNSQIGHSKVNKLKSSETTATYSDSSDDHSDDDLPQMTPSINQAPYRRQPAVEVHGKSGLRTYFDSDNSDDEEDRPKQTLSRRPRLGAGLSQRTKASSATSSDRSSYLQSKVFSESLAPVDYAQETKSTRNSYSIKTELDSQLQTRSSGNMMPGRRSQEQAASNTLAPSKRSSRVELSSKLSQVTDFEQYPPSRSKISDNSGHQKLPSSDEPSAFKPIPESKRSPEENQKSSSPGKSATGGSADTSATLGSRGEVPSRENSINKASHVHPKLPDYDALTAQLMAVRQSRQ